ncbi:MAG: DUF397 domain-containing protein [Pseudonocardiaceae bacterium]
MTSSLAARDVPSPQKKEYGMVEMPQPPTTAPWQKSSTSGNVDEECVQVIRSQGHVWVRDSKNPLGPALRFTCEGWSTFLVGVQRDELDRSGVSA